MDEMNVTLSTATLQEFEKAILEGGSDLIKYLAKAYKANAYSTKLFAELWSRIGNGKKLPRENELLTTSELEVKIFDLEQTIMSKNSEIEELKREVKLVSSLMDVFGEKDINETPNAKIVRLEKENQQLIVSLAERDIIIENLEDKIENLEYNINNPTYIMGVPKYEKDKGHTRVDVPDSVIADAFKQGKKVPELAKVFNMTENGIRHRLKKMGLWIKLGPRGLPVK